MRTILIVRIEVPDRLDTSIDPMIVADDLIDDADYVILDAEWEVTP